jgi:hypothetical protein
MKKITGKVVALVLALALVVTSFSANFAFASTKTMSGTVSATDEDSIYLVNGGKTTTADLTAFLIRNSFKLETKDHNSVTGEKIDAISHVSGDKLVSLSVNSTTDDATIKLKSSTADGKEVISVLYEGAYTDDDGNDYTVKATKELTVYVYDKDAIVYGEKFSGTKDSGTGLDDFVTFAQSYGYTKTLGIYKAEPYSDSTALASYQAAALTTATGTDAAGAIKDSGAYSFSITGNDIAFPSKPVTASVSADETTYTTFPTAVIGKTATSKDASTGNVTITVKKLVSTTGGYKASTDSDDKYVLKTKIEKKADAATVLPGSTAFTIAKTDGKSVLTGNLTNATATVTDCEVVFPSTTVSVAINEDTNVKKVSGTVGTLTIGDANVGSIDIDAGYVDVTDGKVGDITTDGAPVTAGGDSVLVSGGKVGNIKTTDVDNNDNSNVTVTAGTTGTIDANGTVTIEANDEDSAISIGKITAPKISAFSDESKIAISGIKASDDGTITLKGDSTTVGSMDLDYRDTTLNLGDEDDAFTGKLVAPTNAVNAKLYTTNDDTDASINGSVNLDTISLDTDTSIAFDSAVTVDTLDGDGSMKVAAGKLYVTGSASGITLKLSDTTLTAGTVAYKAESDVMDTDSLNNYGFTVTKSAGTTIDTFKIASLSFAGVAINKASSSIAKGYSETFTAGAYPTGTSLPAGATVTWALDGGSSDVFTLTTSGNSATVKVNSIDGTFASENKTTLTATLYDADGYVLDDYDVAKCDLSATALPAATSDTNSALSVAKGASYQMKVTSATVPALTTGSNGVFSVALVSKTGNNYFYKLTAIGTVGASTGVYLNGSKIFVATVKAFAFTCDTTKATVKGAYTFKITSATTPTVSVGSAAFKLAFVSKTGNAYLYKITSAGAVGASAGIYVNGSKAFVATIG